MNPKSWTWRLTVIISFYLRSRGSSRRLKAKTQKIGRRKKLILEINFYPEPRSQIWKILIEEVRSWKKLILSSIKKLKLVKGNFDVRSENSNWKLIVQLGKKMFLMKQSSTAAVRKIWAIASSSMNVSSKNFLHIKLRR